MRSHHVALALAAVAACSTAPQARAPVPAELREAPGPEGFNAQAFVDEAHQEVVVWAGPFRVEPSAGGHLHGPPPAQPAPGIAEPEGHALDAEEGEADHAPVGEGQHAGHAAADEDHHADHAAADEDPHADHAGHDREGKSEDEALPGHEGHTRSPVIPVVWPADGYFRGFALELRDGEGNVLPRSLMHHLIAVNFDRRMFAYPVAERLFGIGTETADLEMPRTVGVPLEEGQNIGFYVMWDNTTGETLDEVYIRLAIPWTPAEEAGDIVEVMPLYVDVNNQIGFTNAYDLVPGRSERSWEFEPPVSGRFLMASGHLHDFGQVVRLEDAATGEVLLEIEGDMDPDGLIRGIDLKVMGVWYGGIRLERGHTYRVVGVYDSPLEEVVPMGAMAHIVGIFAPDDMDAWPEARPDNDLWVLDLTGLPRRTEAMTQARDALRSEGGGR
jgi:hypothetical protein